MPEESPVDESTGSLAPSSGETNPPSNPDAPLNEDLALSRLVDRDLSKEAIEEIAQNSGLMKSRKVRIALASHPRTPRRIALRLIRELYSFELMHFAMLPTAAADLKRIADELLIARIASITLGERISLSRRCSEKVAGALLLDKEAQVWQSALENPRLTEATLVKALQRTGGTALFVEAVCRHTKWSLRTEVRVALLRNAHTPMAKALEFSRRIPPAQLRDILHTSRLPEKIKAYLRNDLESRK